MILSKISTLHKNQAAPIEMIISDFFRIPKIFIAFVFVYHKSDKAKGKLQLSIKGNCNYQAVAMTTAIRSVCIQKHNFLFFET